MISFKQCHASSFSVSLACVFCWLFCAVYKSLKDQFSSLLQMLREKLTEYENKFKELQEKMDDVQAEKVTIDGTYKQWEIYLFFLNCWTVIVHLAIYLIIISTGTTKNSKFCSVILEQIWFCFNCCDEVCYKGNNPLLYYPDKGDSLCFLSLKKRKKKI